MWARGTRAADCLHPLVVREPRRGSRVAHLGTVSSDTANRHLKNGGTAVATDSNQRGKAPSVAAERNPAMDVDSAKKFFGHEGTRVSADYYQNMIMISAAGVGMKVDELNRLMSSPEVRKSAVEYWAAKKHYSREERKFSDRMRTMGPEELDKSRAAFAAEVREPWSRAYDRFAAAARAVEGNVAAPVNIETLERELARRVGRLADGTWSGRGLNWPAAQQVGQTSVPSPGGAPMVGGHGQAQHGHSQRPSMDR